MVVTRAEGSWVYTDDGQKWLDMTSGIGVVNVGHCHPHVVKAAQEQMGKVMHAQVNISFHAPMLQLIQRMKPHLPSELDSFFFWNSGSEAVEAAVKLARHATGKPYVAVVQGGYHGRTIGTMAMTTSKTVYSAGFAPLMPGVFRIPYPYATQMQRPADTPTKELVDECLQAFQDLLDQSVAPRDLGCVVIEPVLGEGGYVAAPSEYLIGMKKICEANGILLVMDEIQSGYGRTGKMFAFQHTPNFVPDILIFAKGIANGLPLSGIASRKELMDTQTPGSMGGTYAGNAVACAAALAVLDVFEAEDILGNVQRRSQQFEEGLHAIGKKLSLPIREVRANGLMIGVEFENCPYGTAGRLSKTALKHNVLLLTCSKYEVIRVIPALNITEAEVADFLKRFEAIAAEVFAK